MQDQGDRPVRPGRPSLISSGQPAEPERQRILSALDGTPAAPAPGAAPARRPRTLLWGGIGVGAVALAAGAFALLDREEGREAGGQVAAAPRTAPAPAVAALPAPAAPTAAAPVEAPAVVHNAPEPVPEPAPEPAPANPLAEMASAQPAPAPASHADQLKAALEKPQPEAHREHKAERVAALAKPAHDKPKEKARAPAKPRAPDSDVTLLAALMAHIQPANRKATPAEQLKVCKQYNAAGEEQCRARLCAGVARDEPACKAAPVMSAAPDA